MDVKKPIAVTSSSIDYIEFRRVFSYHRKETVFVTSLSTMPQHIRKRAWQNFFTGVVLALGPGAYVAITLLGAGGGQTSSVKMANIANSTLYG